MLDQRLRTREVARLEGVTVRTVYTMVRDGRLPAPDEPHTIRGQPDYWLESTIRRARQERQARINACRQEPTAA